MVYHANSKADLDLKLTEAGTKLVVIDFYATWCGPCKIIAPKMEALAAQLEDVVFLKVDVDENDDSATEYEVSAMPTFVFVKNGEKIESFAGANYEKLYELVMKLK